MEMRSNQSIGEIIRYFRLIKNLSQKELATYLNVTESAVSSWERGLSKPGLDIALKLSHEMQMRLEEFYFIPAEKPADNHQFDLFETLKLSRGYCDVHHISYHSDGLLRIDLSLQGMTIDATYVQSEIDFKLYINGQKIKHQKYEFTDSSPRKVMLSPELENVPIAQPTAIVSYYFQVDGLTPMQFIIHENGQSYEILIEEEVLAFILQTQDIDRSLNLSPQMIDKITKAFLFIFKTQPESVPDYLAHYLNLKEGRE